jgi:glycosyltransferase involved in cell wall biosynthesis
MNIAIISAYKNVTGGVETVNRLLMNIFVSEGHRVDLIATEDASGVKIGLFEKIFVGKPALTSRVFKKTKNKYDLVIASGEFGFGIDHPNCFLLFHMSSKAYRDSLGGSLSFKNYFGLTRGYLLQNLVARGKRVVAVSAFLKNKLEDQGVHVDRVISNCVDTELFRPDPSVSKNGKCLFVGRYDRIAKGFDILEKLGQKGLAIDCLTPEKPGDLLNWIGSAEHSRMPGIYRQYSVLLLPSRYESCSVTTLEALASGVPIVTTNVGIGPELIRKIPDFVSEEWGDKLVDSIYNKVRIILGSYSDFSQKARAYCLKHHSYDMYKKEWLSLVNTVKRTEN